MKLLVVSDSYLECDCLIYFKEKYENIVDVMIYCGDFELEVDDFVI